MKPTDDEIAKQIYRRMTPEERAYLKAGITVRLGPSGKETKKQTRARYHAAIEYLKIIIRAKRLGVRNVNHSL